MAWWQPQQKACYWILNNTPSYRSIDYSDCMKWNTSEVFDEQFTLTMNVLLLILRTLEPSTLRMIPLKRATL